MVKRHIALAGLFCALLIPLLAAADTVTLAWDHDAASYEATTAYRLEARPAGQPDAVPLEITVPNDQTMEPVDGEVIGITGSLLLSAGSWDIVCIAIGETAEAEPSNTVTADLPPAPAQRFRILRATITIESIK